VANCAILSKTNNRYSSSATALTASSVASALPAANSQDPDRRKVFRSGTVAVAVTIDVDTGSSQAADAFAACGLTLFSGGAVELYDRGTGGAPGAATLVATLPAADGTSGVAFVQFGSRSARHWQIKFTNPGLVSGYVELGFAFIGPALTPTVNVSEPLGLERNDPSVAGVSLDGQKTFAIRSQYLTGQLEFYKVGTTDRANLDAVFASNGVHTPFFFILDPSTSWQAWLVRLADKWAIGLVGVNLFTYQAQIEEVR
jgi:hypothetical protein